MAVLSLKTLGRILRLKRKKEGLGNVSKPLANDLRTAKKTKRYRKQNKKVADEPVSRILCRTQTVKRPACAAIIPLGHGSHRDSSSLPEGFHPRWLAPPRKERVRGSGDRKTVGFMNANSVSRAGSALLFGLAPRGVFRAPDVAIGAVGSYPTFSPLPNAASM